MTRSLPKSAVKRSAIIALIVATVPITTQVLAADAVPRPVRLGSQGQRDTMSVDSRDVGSCVESQPSDSMESVRILKRKPRIQIQLREPISSGSASSKSMEPSNSVHYCIYPPGPVSVDAAAARLQSINLDGLGQADSAAVDESTLPTPKTRSIAIRVAEDSKLVQDEGTTKDNVDDVSEKDLSSARPETEKQQKANDSKAELVKPPTGEPSPDPKVELFSAALTTEDSQPVWELTLDDSIRLGLANNKEVAVITPLPSIELAKISIERGAFDPVAGISTFGGEDDRQVRSQIATFGAPVGFLNTDYFRPLSGRNQAYLKQQLQSGGTYEIGFGTNYLSFFPTGPQLTLPSGWESALNFEFSQPLFRGRGKDANLQKLRVASARQRQSEFEFRAKLRQIVRDVDIAYWEFAGAERGFKAANSYVKLAELFYEQEVGRYELGVSAKPDILQIQSTVGEFRVNREDSRRTRDVAEMKLRTELGLAQMFYQGVGTSMSYDPQFDLPISAQSGELESVSRANLETAVATSMTRPELAQAHARIEEAQANLAAARNKLQPDIAAHAVYSKLGLEKGLNDSVSTLFSDSYQAWGAGVTYERRLRQRSEHAEVRQFSFEISREQARLNEIAHDFVGKLRELNALIEGSQRSLAERQEYVRSLTGQVVALNELYKDGKVTLFQRLETTRTLQAAELIMFEAWTELAVALAKYRYERGDDPSSYGVEVQPCSVITVEQPL